MTREPGDEKEKRGQTRSSIAVSSETVCEDDACIGKKVGNPFPKVHDSVMVAEKENKKPSTAMSFCGRQGCIDDACIGKI